MNAWLVWVGRSVGRLCKLPPLLVSKHKLGIWPIMCEIVCVSDRVISIVNL